MLTQIVRHGTAALLPIILMAAFHCNAERPLLSLYETHNNWRDSRSNPGQPQPDTLVSIHVAMGAWNMTELMLVSLAQSDGDFDIVLIDDHSAFDVERVAQHWGIRVLQWGSPSRGPRGLTHSWNLVWKYALDWKYKNIIICNNDLLVPRQTINLLINALRTDMWAVLLPSTSKRGSVYPYHSLPLQSQRGKGIARWTDQPLHFQDVASLLHSNITHPMVSRQTLLNGYMMAIRIRMMKTIQFNSKRQELFDPSKINIGNEDELFRRTKLPCGVHLYAFVFHFKGYTATASNRNLLHQALVGKAHADLF